MAFAAAAEFDSLWEKAFNSQDLAGLLDLYDPGVRAVVEPGVSVHGVEALQGVLEQFLAAQPATVHFTSSTCLENGDTALLYGSWTASLTGPDGTIPMAGDAVVALVKKADGWVAVIDDFYGKG